MSEKTMKVIEIKEFGGPEGLEVSQRPVPPVAAGEVRIKVAAAGVNRPDILQRKGFYPPPPGASEILGLEVAGVIDAVGAGVSLPLGTPVMALLPGGGYAAYAVVPASHILPLSQSADLVKAAALPETVYTVWANVFEAGGLTEDSILFVHGATSGIGTMAVAMARAAGALCYGTAGTAEKCAFAERLGYRKCFNYKSDDWSDEMTALGGADIVLDMVGGDYVPRNLALLRPGGRHQSIAVQGGMTAQINLFDVMRRGLILSGSVLRGRSTDEKTRLAGEIKRHVLPWITEGVIEPVIARTFPLEEAGAAHALMESGTLMGKIVLTL
ncbi:MAG: NAD(P)H-quinone oxidoreductase [Parvularcula sp.]